jgi:transposase
MMHNPRLAAFYHRLCDRGKTKKQALCAVAHKLTRICYALVKDHTTFSLQYQPIRA